MNNNMLWMHSTARQARPSAWTMNSLVARYPKGVRFRVHQDVVPGWFAGNPPRRLPTPRTIFKPVIEVVMEVKGRIQWVTYMWLDHEEFYHDAL